MRRAFRQLTDAFGAGSLGGLLNSVAVWLCGARGLTAALGVQIAPALTAGWLFPRIVWGGLWGFLFVLPLWRRSWFLRGLAFSLGPTAVQLLLVFPLRADQGLLGLRLGAFTPAFVVLVNAVWGVSAGFWFRCVLRSEQRGAPGTAS